MTSAFQYFGLSCPSGGTFYICEKSTVPFIGCCTSDPCADGTGKCPAENLRTATFSGDKYDQLPTQDCDDARTTSIWYTCKFNTPPFMGCCNTNPCGSGCPQPNLVPAKLSGDINNRAKFLTPSSTPSSTASAAPNVATVEQQQSSSMSPGTIAGVAVSVGLLVVVIIAILMYKFGWRSHKRRQRDDATIAPTSTASAYDFNESPYYDHNGQPSPFRDSYNSSATAIGSPRNTMGYKPTGHSPDMFAAPFSTTGATLPAGATLDPRHPSPAYSTHTRTHSGGAVPASLPAVYEIDSQPPPLELDSGNNNHSNNYGVGAGMYKAYVPGVQGGQMDMAQQQQQMAQRDRLSFESPFPSPNNFQVGAPGSDVGVGGGGGAVGGVPDSQFASPLGSPRYNPAQQGEYIAVPLHDEDVLGGGGRHHLSR